MARVCGTFLLAGCHVFGCSATALSAILSLEDVTRSYTGSARTTTSISGNQDYEALSFRETGLGVSPSVSAGVQQSFAEGVAASASVTELATEVYQIDIETHTRAAFTMWLVNYRPSGGYAKATVELAGQIDFTASGANALLIDMQYAADREDQNTGNLVLKNSDDQQSLLTFRRFRTTRSPLVIPIAGGSTVTLELTANSESSQGPAGNLAFVSLTDRDSQTLTLKVRDADIDRNGAMGTGDIDMLSQFIADPEANIALFDLNMDDTVDQEDRRFWVEDVARSYFGDADLNGAVEFADFVALADSFGSAGSWSGGDFDGNGQVQFPDFVLLANNFGQTSAAAVPEPSSSALALLGVVAFLYRRRLRQLTGVVDGRHE